MSEGISQLQSKITSTKANLTDYGDHLDKLREAYANGEITETDYYAGLEETRNAIYEQMEALNTLDKEMQNYYGDTLVKAGEEIGKYTDKIENLSGVLDHYQSLLTLIGKENDFQSMGVVL
jgi:chromosome segregation ATPase